MSCKHFIITAILLCGLLLTGSVFGQVLAAEQNLLANPEMGVSAEGRPIWGYWISGAQPAKANDPNAKATYSFKRDSGNSLLTFNLIAPGASVAVNLYCKSVVITPIPAGSLIVVTADARGQLENPKSLSRSTLTASAGLFSYDNPQTPADIVSAPALMKDGKPAPLTGSFDWMPVQVIFALPENTGQVNAVFTVENAVGWVELRNPRVSIAPPGSTPNASAKASRFPTKTQALAAKLAKQHEWWESEKKRLKIPPADQIYTPRAALSGPHPRYLVPGIGSFEMLKQRANDPSLARYRRDLFKQADQFVKDTPVKPASMDVEDPLRGYAERLAWTALAYQLADDPAKKKAYLDVTVSMIDQYTSWGLCPKDLPNSQMIFGVGAAYDWLHDALPAETKNRARQYLVDAARWMRSPENVSAWQWRSQPQWLANHKWWNYAALGMAATVLWGETEPPVQQSELKQWMDEAMQVFWTVKHTFGSDGAPVEGFMYSAYGNAPYFSFAAIADQLTDMPESLLDTPGIRNLGIARLYCALPNNAGFFPWGDTEVRTFTGSEFFRFLASRFKDSKSQLLADLIEKGDVLGSALVDNYDDTIPTYSETKSTYTLPSTVQALPIIMPAERMTFPDPIAVKMNKRFGSVGKTTPGWNVAGSTGEAIIDVAADGQYLIAVKYAAGSQVDRALRIDGAFPFREASYVVLASTGGFSQQKNDFRLAFVGEDVEPRTPWIFQLKAGKHRIALTNVTGTGMNLDYLAIVPIGTSKQAIQQAAGDGFTSVEPEDTEVVAPWRGLFWYNPAIPAASVRDLELHRDNTDLGVYMARSSWTDPRATFFGFRCGPPAGKEVSDFFGFNMLSGHSGPDQGQLIFYYGSKAVLPGANYLHDKQTSMHSVLVFENTPGKTGSPVDSPSFSQQLGGGAQWFGNDYKFARRHAQVIDTQHTPRYTRYLGDLGGVYAIGMDKQQNRIFADYRRSVTYLPSGVLIVVDRVRTPVPKTAHFRLLTAARDLRVDGREFTFTIGRTPGKIIDFSGPDYERRTGKEKISSWPNRGADSPLRDVASLRSVEQTEAVFAVVLGINGSEKGITVQANANIIHIEGVPGGPISFDWRDDLILPSSQKTVDAK